MKTKSEMSERSSKAKRTGKNGEYQILQKLQLVCDEVCANYPPQYRIKLTRNLTQARNGGCDILGVDWLAIEVKKCAQLQIDTWWEQAKRQAKLNQQPVLVYQQSRKIWRVVMFGYLEMFGKRVRCPVTVPLETFQIYLKAALNEQLATRKRIEHRVET